MDPFSSVELIKRAKMEQDDQLRWKYVSALHRRGGREVMDRAVELLDSEKAGDRSLGADILGQLGVPAKPFLEERLSKLTELLERETEAEVLASGATALGHLGHLGALDALLQLAQHPSAEVRFSIAGALPSCLGKPEDERGIQALIELSNDEDEDVRDWAVFGLGSQVDANSAAVREALYSRIDDVHEDTRDEALVGLAHRRDERVIEPLLARLSSDEVGPLNVEAAREIGSPRLYEALVNLKEWWDLDHNLLAEAIERCRPRT
ncbi:MAG: HEAT repeat domain-containing protein [Actinomycetota bacterium]